jgi:hypothetical protein
MDKLRPFTAYPSSIHQVRFKSDPPGKNEINIKEKIYNDKPSSFYSTEDLHECIQGLKSKLNELSNENKLLKTKILKLEKKNSMILSPYKLSSLSSKDSDKHKLFSKFNEIVRENKKLKEEQIRLNKIVDQLMGNPLPDHREIYRKYVKKCIKIKKLKQTIQNTSYPRIDTIKSLKNIRAHTANETKSPARQGKLNINDFIINTDIVQKIYSCSCMNKLEFDEIWSVFNPNLLKSINFLEFSRGMHGLGIDISDSELETFFNSISEEKVLTKNLLEKALIKNKPKYSVSYNELKPALEHLSIKLQIQRIIFDSFLSFFSGEIIDYKDFVNILTSSPIYLDAINSATISNYVYCNKPSLLTKDILSKLNKVIVPWEILSENQEIEMDKKIRQGLESLWELFLKKCSEIDVNNTQTVSFDEFEKVCKTLKFQYDATLEHYLKILFYTDKSELNTVPYLSFVVAYAPEANKA